MGLVRGTVTTHGHSSITGILQHPTEKAYRNINIKGSLYKVKSVLCSDEESLMNLRLNDLGPVKSMHYRKELVLKYFGPRCTNFIF